MIKIIRENQNPQTQTPEFKRWFGNSKVVDDRGNPLVVYHGTSSKFDSFSKKRIGSYSGNFGHFGYGFYFSYDVREARTYGNNILECYLKIENPFYGNDIKYLEKYAKEFGDYEKVDVAIDVNWLLEKLKHVDNKAYTLALAIHKYGYEKGWETFLENNDVSESKLDLNQVSDWVELTSLEDKEELRDYVYKEIKKELGELPKTVKDYPFHSTPALHYMTRLGDSSFVMELTGLIMKDGYDGIIAGSEIVVFHPNQIKSATDNNGDFDPRSNNIYEKTD